MLNAILSSKNKKAAGHDDITYEALKGSAIKLIDSWTEIFNYCYEKSTLPQPWKTSTVYLLYKGKGQRDDLNSYRTISIQCTPLKIYTKIIAERLRELLEEKLSEDQFGFRRGRSSTEAVCKILTDILIRKENRKTCYGLFVDFRKAFDNVDRSLIIRKLEDMYGLDGKLLQAIKNSLSTNYLRIKNESWLSTPIEQKKGIIQGDSLSPYLFVLFIDDIVERLKKINNISVTLYADDLTIITSTHLELNLALENLESWSIENNLPINTEKTKIMKFRRGGRFARHDNFTLYGNPLEISNEVQCLGVTLQPSLVFTKHLARVHRKGIISTLTTRGLAKNSLETGLKLFDIKVRPITLYGLQKIARFLSIKNLQAIDKTKSFFLRRLLSLPASSSTAIVHRLCNTKRFSEYLITETSILDDIPEDLRLEYLLILEEEKMNFNAQIYENGPAFTSEFWKQTGHNNRYLVCGFTAHGFHHLCCKNKKFHSLNSDCTCTHCDHRIETIKHPLECDKIPRGSLSVTYKFLTQDAQQTHQNTDTTAEQHLRPITLN